MFCQWAKPASRGREIFCTAVQKILVTTQDCFTFLYTCPTRKHISLVSELAEAGSRDFPSDDKNITLSSFFYKTVSLPVVEIHVEMRINHTDQ